MLHRLITTQLQKTLRQAPAVALLGPRQSGKTTLAKSLSPVYFDLEQSEDQLRLDLEWPKIIGSKKLVVFDEAQTYPDLFPKLRGAIDAERQRNGRFLLLGSIAPALMKNVSESLAGRLSLCELSPLSLLETPVKYSVDQLWLRGGFPEGGVLSPKKFPLWQRDYLNLLAQRDLPQWGLKALPQTTHRLFKMLAAYHGQVWNASALGSSLGLSYHTVNGYVGYLQNAYLLSRLDPYHVHLKKRLIKSPKIYWSDTGLLHSLLGVSTYEQLIHQPWVGASWESFILHQILHTLKALGKIYQAFFFRTSDGHEIDLLLEFSKGRWAFEFKLTSSPGPEDLKRLNLISDWVHADKRILVSRTTNPIVEGKMASVDIRSCLNLICK